MDRPRKIDIAYADGHWLAELGPDHEAFDCRNLTLLVKAVQRFLAEPLIFVVDQSTVEDFFDAQMQFMEATRKTDAVVILRYLGGCDFSRQS
jgi:hypothetical protein